MNEPKKIISTITEISGKYSAQQIFSDWIEMCALMIQNSCTLENSAMWKKREERFDNVAQRYSEDERMRFCKMFAFLVEAFDNEMRDHLGEIYMGCAMGSSRAGQFFTPFHLSELTAKVAYQNDYGEIRMYEPSCGSGGMVIAQAKQLRDAGEDYQRRMNVLAQDIDSRAVHMCYVQLSLLGIKAVVIRGNTLEDATPQKIDIFHTPKSMGAI